MIPTPFLALETTGIVLSVIGVVVGLVIGWVVHVVVTGTTLRSAKTEAEQVLRAAEAEAEVVRQRAELEAEKKAAQRREEFDHEMSVARDELKQTQNRLEKREDKLDRKLEAVTDREGRLDERERASKAAEGRIAAKQAEIDAREQDLLRRVEGVAGLSVADAKEFVLEETRRQAIHDSARLTAKIIEDAEAEARTQSREITLQAIQRFAADHVVDSTVRSVRIPSDEMKGRIIGREGRNIRALEKATGVDILVDDTPGVIAVSCFDPIRRAMAGEALTRLVADGRVHPARIEEIVESVKKDMQERIQKHGNDAVIECNVRGLHPKIIEAMGKLAFRTSYGQNVLRHSIEVAYLSQMIADQLGLNGGIARRAGFLHDIGKAMDHEMEGGHPAIGMEFAKKYGEKSPQVLNAIGGHHGDIESISVYTPIVMAADSLSGARPGARRESMELYIKRLEQLEGIARELGKGMVEEAHAIQAGREVRVIVDARRADDAQTFILARDIAKRVEEEMTFPGEIKVTVLREVRAEATAR
ncbi:MAG: ribonuclease Y [Phycisphaerales bacterium]|nr:ribonuclease Y [Phycisphaerales bacterium]